MARRTPAGFLISGYAFRYATKPLFVRRAPSPMGGASAVHFLLIKNGPIAGAKFQEATDWWVMSGKAIDSVPPSGTVREVTRRKSEGHGARVCGLSVVIHRSTSRAKTGSRGEFGHAPHKPMTTNQLIQLFVRRDPQSK